jgi:hypothetical protein
MTTRYREIARAEAAGGQLYVVAGLQTERIRPILDVARRPVFSIEQALRLELALSADRSPQWPVPEIKTARSSTRLKEPAERKRQSNSVKT